MKPTDIHDSDDSERWHELVDSVIAASDVVTISLSRDDWEDARQACYYEGNRLQVDGIEGHKDWFTLGDKIDAALQASAPATEYMRLTDEELAERIRNGDRSDACRDEIYRRRDANTNAFIAALAGEERP
jgi:hypothetical protein